MTQDLPTPEVLHCYFDEDFEPHLPAMYLRWEQTEDNSTEQVWRLPEGVSLFGFAPNRFGISVQRLAADTYSVSLLWDRTCVIWLSLARRQLVDSDLVPLLAALGTDFRYLLDQPIADQPTAFPRAA